METTEFTFVRHFRVDNLEFDLLKNQSENYFTICENTETKVKSGMFYHDFEEFYEVFSDDFTEEELR